MFFRKFVVGRFGIPKHGDNDEYPLGDREVLVLKRLFAGVNATYPKLMLFDLLGVYFTPRNFKIRTMLRTLDERIYPLLPFLGKYGYRQLIEIKK